MKHLAIIIDGLNIEHAEGGPGKVVERAFEKASEVAQEAFRIMPELDAVSLFSPEMELLLRTGEADGPIVKAMAGGIELMSRSAAGLGVGMSLHGRLDELPPLLKQSVPDVAAEGRKGSRINWFIYYSGRDEIARAADKYLRDFSGENPSEETFSGYLDTSGQPDPDLILLVGGELKPKDFLLWQASYAEIVYSPKGWLDFSASDLAEAVETYKARQRRFGRV